MQAPVPLCDLSQGIAAQRAELDAAIARVVQSGAFIDGPDVAAFEQEMASYLAVGECVGLSSGTDALVIGLKALGVGRGHEVIVPAFTFFASAEAVSLAGATPVFVDIDPKSFNLDAHKVKAALTRHTKAIIVVHLFGQAARMDDVMTTAEEHGLAVLEDTAQALGGTFQGRKLGSIGHAAALSFFPSKNLGAFGDGGLLATNSLQVAEAARRLRQHGSKTKYQHEMLGYNSRLDAIQAAVLRVKLPTLDTAVARRRAAALRYDALLAAVNEVQVPWRDPDGGHSFHQYVVRVPPGRRDGIRGGSMRQGIQTAVHYPSPVHRQPAYRELGAKFILPEADAACTSVLSLPLWPEITTQQQERVVAALTAAAR
jgi:dTDP-4-amino-4,6-dideoxygalactose transaminase